jgi:hypothetical protein
LRLDARCQRCIQHASFEAFAFCRPFAARSHIGFSLINHQFVPDTGNTVDRFSNLACQIAVNIGFDRAFQESHAISYVGIDVEGVQLIVEQQG